MSDRIELQDIGKSFVDRSLRSFLPGRTPKETRALRNLTLTIGRGEIFGILGPNGAGKTTLMKILATVILPDSGKGSVFGFDLIQDSRRIRRIIGLVAMSERSFYWRLTGRQNLNFFASLYDLAGREKRRRLEELLRLVDLEEKADIEVMKYSAGQKQRLALARALLSNADILLMDEPTQNLDPLAAADFVRLAVDVLNRREGKTIVWCTHNLREAEEVCSRMAILHRGSVIASGDFAHMCSLIERESVYEVSIDHCPDACLNALGIAPSRILHLNGRVDFEVRATSRDAPNLVKKMVDSGVGLRSFREKTVDLDDVFERVIRRVH